MAEMDVKDEPQNEQATLFVDGYPPTPATAPAADSPSSALYADIKKLDADTTSLFFPTNYSSKHTFQRCAHLSLWDQVQIKEHSVADGSAFLSGLEKLLRKHSVEVKSSLKWLDRIKAIRAEKRECRILIGFLGVTGAGKSSLINALLEYRDLLPADDEKACTAVCVEVSWNPDDDEAHAFGARVERITPEDWRAELAKLFKDISDEASGNDGDQDEPDVERSLRINQALQKIKCVYPHIKTQEDLIAQRVDFLMDHPNVKNILGKPKFFHFSDLKEFSVAIRPYIDSSTSNEDRGRSFAQWPLVKLVALQIKSPILMNGVVLVDLPGSMDTNAARGSIAENYQKNLSVTCVVAATARAASDKPAQDLLGKVTQRTMLLDNRFTSDHLCFIVSKTDTSITPDRYIDTHPNVKQLLEPTTGKLDAQKANLSIAEKRYEGKENDLTKNEKLRKKLENEFNKTVAAIRKLGAKKSKEQKHQSGDDISASPPPPSEAEITLRAKHKDLEEEYKATKSDSHLLSVHLLNAKRKIEKLEDAIEILESQTLSACIKNRNGVLTTDLRADYEATLSQIGQDHADKPLQVFCVSAKVYFDFQKGATKTATKLGFSKMTDTNVPALQEWLIRNTLPTRDRNANAFLEALVSLELSMKPWIENKTAEYKMEDSQREEVEKIFERNVNALAQKFSELNLRVSKDAKVLVEANFFSALPKLEASAAAKSIITVKNWAQLPTQWSSHRAANRGYGEWKTSKGVQLDWVEDLLANYLDDMVKIWTIIVNNRLPPLRSKYDDGIIALIRSFVDKTDRQVEDTCPDMKHVLDHWKESIIRTSISVKKHTLSVFEDTVQPSANEAHRMVKPKIEDCWFRIFERCGAEKGQGHYKRNQDTHNEHIKRIGRVMYRRGTKSMHSAFTKLFNSLPGEFANGTYPILSQVKEEFEQVLENHSVKGDREFAEKNECAAKVEIQHEYFDLLNERNLAWNKQFPEGEIVEEEPVEDVNVDLESLFNDAEEHNLASLSDDEEGDCEDDTTAPQ